MNESKNSTKRHILSPVNARAHIKRDRTERPLRSINKPRIIVDLLLDEVPLSLTDVSIINRTELFTADNDRHYYNLDSI